MNVDFPCDLWIHIFSLCWLCANHTSKLFTLNRYLCSLPTRQTINGYNVDRCCKTRVIRWMELNTMGTLGNSIFCIGACIAIRYVYTMYWLCLWQWTNLPIVIGNVENMKHYSQGRCFWFIHSSDAPNHNFRMFSTFYTSLFRPLQYSYETNLDSSLYRNETRSTFMSWLSFIYQLDISHVRFWLESIL